MGDYVPAYRKAPAVTLEHFDVRLEELPPILSYAVEHDDMLVLDELFCKIVALEHRLICWEREREEHPYVTSSIKELNRALKWAWLARDKEDHAGGMYAHKLKEAINVLHELQVFLHSERNRERMPVETKPAEMTREQAETLAATIKARPPQAEGAVRAGSRVSGRWRRAIHGGELTKCLSAWSSSISVCRPSGAE